MKFALTLLLGSFVSFSVRADVAPEQLSAHAWCIQHDAQPSGDDFVLAKEVANFSPRGKFIDQFYASDGRLLWTEVGTWSLKGSVLTITISEKSLVNQVTLENADTLVLRGESVEQRIHACQKSSH